MTTETAFPPHGRLVTKLTAIGPYLRQQQSKEGEFFFDCLASCISAKKEPEEREFWGWWLVMTESDKGGYQYRYHFGRYNADGNWVEDKVPAKHSEAVLKTLNDFYPKLTSVLDETFEQTIAAADDLTEAELG
ncbi:XRE family transcriptional regulator [Photobacterium jeanii]|uniref:Sigma factor-binding protein Crl n=1 Tax=Photobacterium jeanii TaxID=858640 RepID=A0A178K973_9GAMM|nr:sigma factor-binding protein Crl [Photobacterium jeanii]OAN13899.1 XRE family transcriptional regulator [Photobacterium jeanii]PST89884.1 Crl family RNA polymerase assembly factor [Photobacterium jeanii]